MEAGNLVQILSFCSNHRCEEPINLSKLLHFLRVSVSSSINQDRNIYISGLWWEVNDKTDWELNELPIKCVSQCHTYRKCSISTLRHLLEKKLSPLPVLFTLTVAKNSWRKKTGPGSVRSWWGWSFPVGQGADVAEALLVHEQALCTTCRRHLVQGRRIDMPGRCEIGSQGSHIHPNSLQIPRQSFLLVAPKKSSL